MIPDKWYWFGRAEQSGEIPASIHFVSVSFRDSRRVQDEKPGEQR